MSSDRQCRFCGSPVDGSGNFCGQCGQPVSGRITCPHCGEDVPAARFCGKCGKKMHDPAAAAATSWDRGEEVFAVRLPETKVHDAESGFEVRHGSKALFFENGRLVDIAESRRYTRGDSFLRSLFAKKRRLSAVLVDGGDVVLPFAVPEVMTGDNIEIGVQLDVVLRLDDHNAFYVNVMKDRDELTTRDLRAMLFPEVKNSVQEAIADFVHAQLSPSRAAKEEVASRLEHHLRTTFGRIGLDFGQVRAIEFSQDTLDKTAKKGSVSEATARDIEADARGNFRVERARQDADRLGREVEKGRLDSRREDLEVRKEEQGIELDESRVEGEHRLAGKKQGHGQDLADREADKDYKHDRLRQKKDDLLGQQQIKNDYSLEHQARDNSFLLQKDNAGAEFLEKRLEVYRRLKKTDISKIKTDEDFRKFRLEVDRDQVLDDAEWEEFREELVWKKQDRQQQRAFLVKKVELQERFDLARLKIIHNSDLSITVKEQKLRQAEMDWDREKRELAHKQEREWNELAHEQKVGRSKFDHAEETIRSGVSLAQDIEQKQAEHEATVNELREMAEKNLDVQKRIKELEIRKAELAQALEQNKAEVDLEVDKALARDEINKLDVELNRLQSEMALANLEKLKKIKREDQQKKELHELELEKGRFEMEEKRAAMQREREAMLGQLRQEEMKTAGKVETDRLEKISSLSIEQLIAVSGLDQARVLGELGRTQTLKGMSSEEIMAMNDPAALGKALEERARGVAGDELKALYERMMMQAEVAAGKINAAYQDSADRAERMSDRSERMFNRGMDAMQGTQEEILYNERRAAAKLAASERHAADRTERMAAHGLKQMGGVATTRARPAGSGAAGGTDAGDDTANKVRICSTCKREVSDKENFCPNCGTKMY